MSFTRPLLLSLALAFSAPVAPAMADLPADIQKRVEEGGGIARIGDREIDLAPIREFYRTRGFKLAWSGAGAEARGDRMLLDLQSMAMSEGLVPEWYGVHATGSDIERDILVSDALVRFGRDLAAGRVAPAKTYGGMGPETRPAFDSVKFLRDLAAGKDLLFLVEQLPPPFAGYQRLKMAVEQYRTLARAGGWPVIPDGASIKPGMDDERVLAVRKRLIVTGELAAQHDKGRALDAPLSEALKKFQARHGLDQDGAVGKQTLNALNVTAEQRLAQVQVNLERWRWMPRNLAPTHIAVNLPAARLELVENGAITMAMNTVVGDPKHQTPPMVTTMSAVVLNPTWTVPPSIAAKEILPKLRKDPNYLAANNMRILDAFPENSAQSSGRGIDWSRYSSSNFPYKIRQQAGADNALGQVKFILKDSDDIYLHDTNSRQFFAKANRALSHGCVRVERPIHLAEALLGANWEGKVDDAIGESETRTVKLERTITVYLLYMTSWVDGTGIVHFRDDMYGHDGRLKAALKKPRVTPPPAVAQQEARGSY